MFQKPYSIRSKHTYGSTVVRKKSLILYSIISQKERNSLLVSIPEVKCSTFLDEPFL
jgi:hypothetical protein